MYVYQYNPMEDRGIIHTKIVDGFEQRSEYVEAPSWIAAKHALGFPLTALQKEMFGRDHAHS
jgi:hypothetical protein